MPDNELKDVFKAIDKVYGKESVSYLSGDRPVPKEVLPTGIASLDMAVGNNGLVTGSIIEIYGPESGGKTSISLFIIAEAQKLGHTCAFIDMEHALDTDLANAYGVDTKKLVFDQPESGEEALGKTEMLLESGKVKVIVIDSVDSLVPRSVLEGDFGDSNMGRQAKMMSQAMRKLSPLVENKKALLIFINQIRMKIGAMYGSPETTPGGNALKFYSKYRLDVRRRESIKDKELIIGAITKIKVKKNKKAPPFRECLFNLIYGKGIDKEVELVAVGIALNIIERSGSWMSMCGEQIGQGSKSVIEKCKSDISFKDKLEDLIKKHTIEPKEAVEEKDDSLTIDK